MDVASQLWEQMPVICISSNLLSGLVSFFYCNLQPSLVCSAKWVVFKSKSLWTRDLLLDDLVNLLESNSTLIYG